MILFFNEEINIALRRFDLNLVTLTRLSTMKTQSQMRLATLCMYNRSEHIRTTARTIQ